MLAFNQTKHDLTWSLAGQKYSCEAWGSVDVPEELWSACKRLGLPLDVASVPPELRAQVRIEDERKASDDSALHALKERAEKAEVTARSLKGELERTITERDEARGDTKRALGTIEELRSQLARANADKATAEEMLDAEAKRATDAEAARIKAEALLAEKSKQPKAEKPRASAG